MSIDINSFQRMKLNNRIKVLGLLHRESLSRVEIARRAKLTKQTVTNIINELLEQGLVTEESVQTPLQAGRPATYLRLRGERLYSIGIELTKGCMRGALVTYEGTVLHQSAEESISASSGDGSAALASLFAYIERLIEKAPGEGTLLGIGLGVQGLVDMHSGIVKASSYLGWYDFPLREHIESKFGLLCTVDINVRAFGWREVWLRREQRINHVFFINLDDGVSGAILTNGQVFVGEHSLAGEIGHVKIEPGGRQCRCGKKGCLEAYVSIPDILQQLRIGHGSFSEVMQRLERGDPDAVFLFKRLGAYLGSVIGNAINLLNPGAVIFGGKTTLAKAWFLDELRGSMMETVIRQNEQTAIYVSDYHINNCSIGAAALVFEEWLKNPLSSANSPEKEESGEKDG